MKITSKTDFGGNENYQITISREDDIEGIDIAESFKYQYPKNIAVVCFSRITAIEFGLIIVGLNMK